ncbi:hypothetical protein GCM10010407_16410 [Rarobacter incanus]
MPLDRSNSDADLPSTTSTFELPIKIIAGTTAAKLAIVNTAGYLRALAYTKQATITTNPISDVLEPLNTMA